MATGITILRLVFASIAIAANVITTPTQHWIDRAGAYGAGAITTKPGSEYPDGHLTSVGIYQSCFSNKGCQLNHFRFRRIAPVFNDQDNRFPVYEAEYLFPIVQVFFGIALSLQILFYILTLLHHMGNRLDKHCYNPPLLMGVAYIVIVLFTLIGACVFTGKMCTPQFIENVFVRYTGGEREVHINDYRLGWCFYVNVLGAVCNIATAVLFFVKNRDDFKKV